MIVCEVSVPSMHCIPLFVIFLGVFVTGEEQDACSSILNMKEKDLIELRFQATISNATGFSLEFGANSGDFNLTHTFYFSLQRIVTQKNSSYMCLNLRNSEIRTMLNETLLALVMIATNPNVPVGMYMINNACLYGGKKHIVECGYFVFMKEVLLTSVFLNSPLEEDFWLYLNDEYVFKKNWIEELAIASMIFSIPTAWTSKLKLSNLKELVIAGNMWGYPENMLGYLPNLKSLFLPENNIIYLPDGILKNTSVEVLNLQMNKLETLPHGLPTVKELNLSNQSSVLSISDEVISTLGNITLLTINTRVEANISNILKLPRMITLHCRACWIGEIETLDDDPWTSKTLLHLDLGRNNLTSLSRKVFEKLTNLVFLALDNNNFQTCPCNALSSLEHLNHLNLSRNSINEVKASCFSQLSNLTVLDLSWNKLVALENSTFENVGNLVYLNLSHNDLIYIEEYAFLNLISLEYLQISDNNLTEAPYFEMQHLNELDLSDNVLMNVSKLASIKHISHLDLSGNNITELKLGTVDTLNLTYNELEFISDDMWKYLEHAKVLDLGGNHFLCCHTNFSVLQSRFNDSWQIIRNLNTNEHLFCFPDTQSASVLLSTFSDQDTLCFNELVSVALLVAGPIGALSFLMILFTAVIYYYRFEFNYIRFLLKKKKSGEEKDDLEAPDCVYDAFVCYSWKNENWVVRQLIPNLEKDPHSYRLCLHSRDFTIGAAIDKNVTEALKKSRKVICVLSQHFLSSKWCQWELSMATHKMFQEGRDYIILIELERFQRTNLPADLEYLMDSRTYLEWPQRTEDQRGTERCWQRLRHSLGDSLMKRTGKKGPEGSVLDL